MAAAQAAPTAPDAETGAGLLRLRASRPRCWPRRAGSTQGGGGGCRAAVPGPPAFSFRAGAKAQGARPGRGARCPGRTGRGARAQGACTQQLSGRARERGRPGEGRALHRQTRAVLTSRAPVSCVPHLESRPPLHPLAATSRERGHPCSGHPKSFLSQPPLLPAQVALSILSTFMFYVTSGAAGDFWCPNNRGNAWKFLDFPLLHFTLSPLALPGFSGKGARAAEEREGPRIFSDNPKLN